MEHLIDFLVSMVTVCEKIPNRRGDWIDEGDHIPEVDVGYCISVVGLIFSTSMMTTGNLELIIQPFLVVGWVARVMNPLLEALAHAV